MISLFKVRQIPSYKILSIYIFSTDNCIFLSNKQLPKKFGDLFLQRQVRQVIRIKIKTRIIRSAAKSRYHVVSEKLKASNVKFCKDGTVLYCLPEIKVYATRLPNALVVAEH